MPLTTRVRDAAFAVATFAVAVAVSLMPVAPKKLGDIVFHENAKTVVSALRAGDPGAIRIDRAPGPVLFYAVPYMIVPPQSPDRVYWLAGVVFGILAVSASVVLIHRAGTLAGGPLAGVLSGLVALASPLALYYAFGIAAEPMAYLGVAILVYGWARSWSAARIPWWGGLQSAAGLQPRSFFPASLLIAAGLSVLLLARPNAAIVLLFVALSAAVLWRRGLENRARAAASGVLLAAAVAALFTVALWRQGSRPETSQAGNFYHVAFHGSFQYRDEPFDWRYWDDTLRAGSLDYAAWQRTAASLSAEAARGKTSFAELRRRWVFADFLHHPFKRLQMAAIRCVTLNLWLANSKAPAQFRFAGLEGWPACILFHALANASILFVLASAARFLWIRRRDAFALWGLWAPYLGLLLFHALVYAEPRYLFPAAPSLSVASGLLLARPAARLIAAWKARAAYQIPKLLPSTDS